MQPFSGDSLTPEDRLSERRSLDVVVALSYESLGDIVRRGFARPPDRLLTSLIADPAVRLMIVEPFRSQAVLILKRLARRREPTLPEASKVVVVQPRRCARGDPTTIGALERHYGRFDRIVAKAVRREGLVDPVLITFHPMVAGFSAASWARSVTFYARDDWASSPGYARWHSGYVEAYKRVRQLRRRVVAVSEVLLNRLDPTASSAVVANGVHPDEWRQPGPAPSWYLRLPRPRLLYVGTLDDRLDLDAIERLSERFEGGTIVLAGPLPLGSPVAQINRPNIHVKSNQSRTDLVGLVHASDLCLLTHRETRLTTAMSPLKLYEYLAGGRPVLSPMLPPVRNLHPQIAFYRSIDEVVSSAEEALLSGPMQEQDRQHFIQENSWRRRHVEVLRVALERVEA